MARRIGTCTYCLREGVVLSRDHVVPLSRGGHRGRFNLCWACIPCNNYKASRLLSELPANWTDLAALAMGQPEVTTPRRRNAARP